MSQLLAISSDWFVLPLIGVVAGLLGGLLGIGGGLVIIPALLLTLGKPFGPGSLHVYKIAALATAITLSVPAAWQHLRAGAVVRRMIPACEAFGVLGVIVGVAGAACLSHERTIWLQRIFGATMIATVIADAILRVQRGSLTTLAAGASCPAPSRWQRIGLCAGFPAGIVSGLLGIGGGVWAVPVFHRVFHLRLTSAIANSTCMIVGIALTAAITQSIAVSRMPELDWTRGWRLALVLAPGAMLGGAIGARLTHMLPLAALRICFSMLLIATGVRLLM